MRKWLARSLLSASLLIAPTGFAQTGPFVTEISKLPVIQKLEQTPGWIRVDSEMAINQIVAYLKEKGEYAPIDCRFEISDPIRVPYDLGEVRSDRENPVRRQFPAQTVLLRQYSEWPQYPDEAPSFKPTNPANPDWIAFLNLMLPYIEENAKAVYPAVGLRTVTINGCQTACADIKIYLRNRFKIRPDNVTCLPPREYETMHATDVRTNTAYSSSKATSSESRKVTNRLAVEVYKLGYPHADGLEFQKIRLIDCTFKEEKQPEELPLLDTAPKQPGALPHRKTTVPPTQAKVEPKPEPPAETRAQKKEREREELRKEIEDRKHDEEVARQKEVEYERAAQERVPRWVSPADLLPGLAVPKTELGQKLVHGYQDTHQTPHRDQPLLDTDEKRLQALKKEYEKKERDAHEKLRAKYPESVGEFDRFDLDPESPFSRVSVVVDVPLYPEELARLEQEFQKRNPGWMVDCRVRSFTRKERDGSVITMNTTIECLVPRFVTWYKAMGDGKPGIRIPVPVIGDVCKATRNGCGIMIGTRNRTGIKFSQLSLFGKKGRWETREAAASIAYQSRQITEAIEITGGLKGRVIDAFTKKPIAGAGIVIHGKQDYAQPSDTAGNFQFNPVAMKGLVPTVHGSHRYYHPGSKNFPRLKIFEITDIGDLELEPKRVTIRGKVNETFHPKYGSGIDGITVQVKGYPQFNAVTKPDGTYEIKNVPAVLTDVQVNDPTGGHQEGNLNFTLDPDKDNEGLDVTVVPNLTTVSGRVHISNGRGAPKMRVQIPGHPELFAITDEDGRYEIKDVPHDIAGLQVFPDPDGDYDGKSEPMDGLSRYQANSKDIEVHYNRCDVSGQIVNLVTLQPIPGATVWIEGGGKKYTVTADANGNYEIRKIPISARRVRASTADRKYFPAKPRTIDPVPAEGLIIENQDIRLMPKDYTTDRIVVVLTWNSKQPDLDSQLYVPGKIRLYFANHNDAAMSDKIGGYLDVDDTGYGGRETTIIELEKGRSKVPGVYRFMVYQFADVGLTFQEGGAHIDVYKDGQLWREMDPPPGRGLLWYALAVDDRNVQVKNLIRNYPEFKEYSTLSKEYAEYDRKIADSEAKVTVAKQRYELTVTPLNAARDALDQKLAEFRDVDLNPPKDESEAQLKKRQDAQALVLAPLKKRAADAQRVHDAALAEQDRRIAEDAAYKEKVGKRKDVIKERLEKLSTRLNELLNNPI